MRVTPGSVSILPAARLTGAAFRGYMLCIAGLVLAIAFLDLANYLQIQTSGALLPKYVYYIVTALIAPIMAVRPDLLDRYLRSSFVVWLGAAIVLNICHWLANDLSGRNEAAAFTLLRLQYLALAAIMGFAVFCAPLRFTSWISAGLALTLTALQLYDFTFPGEITPIGTEGVVLGRAGSTLVNANRAAEALILCTLVGMLHLPQSMRLAFFFITLPGVFVSFSRSGWAIWVVAFALCYMLRVFPRRHLAAATVIVIALILFQSEIFDSVLRHVEYAAVTDIYARLSFLLTLETADASTTERLAVSQAALHAFYDHPIFGAGSAYTRYWSQAVSTHNQHLLILSEYGLVGFAGFAALLALILKAAVSRKHAADTRAVWITCFIVTIAFTPFTHNMFDNVYWLLFLSLLSTSAIQPFSLSGRPNRRKAGELE